MFTTLLAGAAAVVVVGALSVSLEGVFIDQAIARGRASPATPEVRGWLIDKHQELAWRGYDSLEVLELSARLNPGDSPAELMGVLSDLCGQCKHMLLKQYMPAAMLAALLRAYRLAESIPTSAQVNHEVRLAPRYHLSRVPVIGRLWRADTLTQLSTYLEGLGEDKRWTLTAALTAAKLYRLDERLMPLDKALSYKPLADKRLSEFENQLRRISEILGMRHEEYRSQLYSQ